MICAIFCVTSSGEVRSADAASASFASCSLHPFERAGAGDRLDRRMPAAMPVSSTILKKPMSPVRFTCVPPQSSVEKSPMPITRTSSPYFSPKSAIAPRLDGFVVLHDARRDFDVAPDLVVHEHLDLADLRGRHRLVVREIEARPLRIDERAFLLNVRAEHLAQRRVHEMRRGMVPRRPRPRAGIDVCVHLVADPQPPRAQTALVAEHLGLDLLGVLDDERAARAHELAAVADLTSRLRRRTACDRARRRPPRRPRSLRRACRPCRARRLSRRG